MVNYNEILRYFPNGIAKVIDKELQRNDLNCNLLEEIRLRVNKPVILKFRTN